MSSYQALETLLAVRQAAEDAAAQALAAAIRRRAAAQETQQRLEAELAAAREDLRERRREVASLGAGTAGEGAGRERFWRRLADAIEARADRGRAHRQGPLADADVGVDAAQATYREAREARELVQKLLERAASERRLVAERRAEAAMDEQAAARARTRFGGGDH
jgi:flagellar export protein FliJ